MMLIGPTLGRYFAARFLRTVLGVFVTVFALVYTLDFVELLRRAGEAQGASAGLMAQLSLYRTPAVAEGVLPFAILFGSMAALLQLSRKLELVVARAAGISAWQFLQPGFFVALTLGALAVGVYNPVSALLKQRSTEIEAKIFAKSTKASSGKDLWIRQKGLDGEAILRAETAIEGTTTLAGVSVFTFDAAGKFAEQLVAARATLHDGYWELSDVRVLTPDTPPESFDTYLIASNLDPAQVRQGFTPPNLCLSGNFPQRSRGPSGPVWTPPDTGSSTMSCGQGRCCSWPWSSSPQPFPYGSSALVVSENSCSVASRPASLSTWSDRSWRGSGRPDSSPHRWRPGSRPW